MKNINAKLIEITYDQIKPLLDKAHTIDSVAGILIVKIPGIEVKSDKGLTYHFYAARVFAYTPTTSNFMTPHYHLHGTQPHYILSGEGCEMNLARIRDGKIVWQKPKILEVGNLVDVQEGEIHSLRNTGKTSVDFTFACPDSHLLDHSLEHPEGDRYVVTNLPNGIPSQYTTLL